MDEDIEKRLSRTKHAPDLLEGPDIDQESKKRDDTYFLRLYTVSCFVNVSCIYVHTYVVPDITFSGVDDSPHLLKPLLSALGISQGQPMPQRFEFTAADPMGEGPYRLNGEDALMRQDDSSVRVSADPSTGHFKISPSCSKLMNQAQKLKSMEENMAALNRITAGTRTLVARHIIMMLVSNLSTLPSKVLTSTLRNLGLLNIRSLVQLLRLVDSGRICQTPGEFSFSAVEASLYPVPALQSLGDVIAAVVSDETEGVSTGLHLMQSCSRDLLTAAVGGAELIQQAWRDQVRHHRTQAYLDKDSTSDVAILANPNFKVTQRLVKILAKSAGKLVSSAAHVGGVVQVMNALAACLFSSKLHAQHRFWALQQLAKVFAVTGAGDVLCNSKEQQHPLKGELLLLLLFFFFFFFVVVVVVVWGEIYIYFVAIRINFIFNVGRFIRAQRTGTYTHTNTHTPPNFINETSFAFADSSLCGK